FPSLWMQPLSNCFKLLPRYLSTQTQQLRALAMPFTLDTTAFIVVVAVFQMPLSISRTTRHCPQSQHNPTLTLFEIRMQQVVSRYPAEEHSDAGPRRAHPANPHGIRAEREDAVEANQHRDLPALQQSRLILRASIGENIQKNTLATLA
ncbi:MAG: hypothetical protein ABSD44_10345, partial [Terracidiphilus sp.]